MIRSELLEGLEVLDVFISLIHRLRLAIMWHKCGEGYASRKNCRVISLKHRIGEEPSPFFLLDVENPIATVKPLTPANAAVSHRAISQNRGSAITIRCRVTLLPVEQFGHPVGKFNEKLKNMPAVSTFG